MPTLSKISPILFLSADDSYFAELHTDGKTPELANVTKIELPLVKDTVVQTEYLEQTLRQLELKTVHLVLSDELFLHHIGDFPVNDKMSLEEHISNTVTSAFPNQDEPLHIVTLDLAKTSRIQTIQITAATKQNLQHIADALHAAKVSLKSLVPASFVVKAFVSIDPSLFLLEMPHSFLLTSHYIGVEYAKKIDQNNEHELLSTLEKLKDTHPHLQHIYLSLSEDHKELVDRIEGVFPTQSVTIPKIKAESDTPHILKVLTLGYKEIIENKFPFPQFELPTSTAKPSTTEPEIVEKEMEQPMVADVFEDEAVAEETLAPPKPVLPKKKLVEPEPEDIEEEVVEEERVEKEEEKEDLPVKKAPEPMIVVPIKEEKSAPSPIIDVVKAPEKPITMAQQKSKGGWFSYVLLACAVALIISLVGGGIIISQQAISNSSLNSPVTQGTPEPSPSPTATPTPTPVAVKKDEVSILIVNATKKAGYAGTTASTFKKAGYTDTQTGNAKGTYEEAGTFIMVSSSAPDGLADQIKKDVDVQLTDLEFDKAEDSAGKYDVIVVLNE